MKGIGPELPLSRDHRFGNYSLVTTYTEEIKQNFKNLLLTSPGERVMNPDFGVGLRRFLFEPRESMIPNIRQRIISQASKYLPFLEIIKIVFDQRNTQNELQDSNMLSIVIEYQVPSLNFETSITLQSKEIK